MKTITYHSQVAQILRTEAEAIAATAERLSSAKVERAIELLLACGGKIVLCGVGKSGIIAEKIAATMTSTGTPALCLRPTDALHGGLGIITSDDTVIILSNSGETEELVQMLPALTARRVPIIAILGNTRSTLARAAHVVLDASVDREVCPLGLAPTASTTVALALGDALAMTLMEAKGWTVEDFAFNHPAGRIGKRLTLRVRDLMHAGEHTPRIELSANWLTAIAAIGRGGLGAVCVTDADDKLLGIITDGDVRRALEETSDGEAIKLDALDARDLMTPNPITCSPDMLAYDALRLMEDRPSQINVLPVTEESGRLVGMIRLHDIVRNGI